MLAIKESLDWLEKSIADENLNNYEYSEFKNLKLIGEGSFGNVISAKWKNTDRFFALKSFKNDSVSIKEVVNE
ncbi:9680_t:CDS:2 [Funneliformis mosseae]|uniref:9680_t:CDS:1 n=1 Tax=Funneliformis mosseae TaxID=27381 RepID=A0A9N9AXN9_FUNMO|nr:9680_t:CDS:2 [Funneliformis mosseae]